MGGGLEEVGGEGEETFVGGTEVCGCVCWTHECTRSHHGLLSGANFVTSRI